AKCNGNTDKRAVWITAAQHFFYRKAVARRRGSSSWAAPVAPTPRVCDTQVLDAADRVESCVPRGDCPKRHHPRGELRAGLPGLQTRCCTAARRFLKKNFLIQEVGAGLIKMSYLGNSGWRSRRFSTARIARLLSVTPFWQN